MRGGIADLVLHLCPRPANGARWGGEVAPPAHPESASAQCRATLMLRQAFAQHPLGELGELLRRG